MANRYAISTAFNLIDNFTKPLDKITGSTNVVGKAIKKNYIEAQERVDNFGKTVEKVTGVVKKAALAIQGAAIAAAGAFVVSGVKGAIDFQKSMEKVGAQANLSKEQIAAFSNELIKVSNTTGKAVSELSNAQLYAISNGVKAADSIQFLEVATKAATGGFTDTTKVIDSLTSALKSYGLEASDAGKISDQMMAAARAGGVSFEDMATKLEKVLPVAAKYGVSSEKLFASIATLTSQGVPIADAAKKIKSALEKDGKLNIFNTAEAEKFNNILNQINVSAGATDEAFNRVDKTIGEQWNSALNKIKNTGLKLGTALLPVIQKIIEKVSLFVDKFSDMDFGPFIAQIEATVDRVLNSFDFEKIVSGMEGFFSTLSKGFNIVTGLIELVMKFKGVILAIGIGGFAVKRVFDGIAIAGRLAPLIGDLKTAGSLMKGLSNGSHAAQSALSFLTERQQSMFAVMQGLQKVGTKIFVDVPMYIANIIKQGVVTSALAVKNFALAVAQKAQAAAQWLVNAAMTANPIGLIIAGIVALIAIIVLLVKNWDKIIAVLGRAWEWIKKVASIVKDGLCNAFESLTGFIKDNSEKVLAFIAIFTGPFGFIISIVKELHDNWGAIVDAFKTDGIIAGFKKLGGVILSAVLAPIQGLLEVLAKIPGVNKLLGPAVEKIQSFRDSLKGTEIDTEIIDKNVSDKTANIAPRAITQTTTAAPSHANLFERAVPENRINNIAPNAFTKTASTVVPPMTTAEQYKYSETTNREEVDIRLRAEPGTSARVPNQTRSPNIKLEHSGAN